MPDAELGDRQVRIVSWPHTDEHFVLIPPNVTLASLDEAELRLAELGLELMEEEECPSELLDDGSVKVWCAVVDGGG